MKFTVEEKSVELLNELLPLIARTEMPFPHITPNDTHGFTLLWDCKHNSNTLVVYVHEVYEVHIIQEEQRVQKTDEPVLAFSTINKSINELDLRPKSRYGQYR